MLEEGVPEYSRQHEEQRKEGVVEEEEARREAARTPPVGHAWPAAWHSTPWRRLRYG